MSDSAWHAMEPPPADLPAERGVDIWRTAIIMPFISFVFVGMRFYTKAFIVKNMALADCKCPEKLQM